MTEHKGSLQWEGSTDDTLSPGQFLREIDNKIEERNYTTDKQMVNCMRNNIAYGSGADEWFGDLSADDKKTYEKLTAAFEKQWPLTTAPKASKAERIQILKEWVLKAEDLGKKVEGPGGTMIWSHVKWATGLTSRVRDAEDTTGFLLSEVYNNLPRPVRELIRKEPRATYDALITAVLALDTSDLKETAADFARDQETARLARQPPSPTKAIREALQTTRIHAAQPQYPDTPPNPYNAAPREVISSNPFPRATGRGNLFNPTRGAPVFPFRGAGPGALGMGRGAVRPQQTISLRDRHITLRHQDLGRFALPHHPNTPEGHAAYQAQVTTWHAANPNRKPDEQHPYPLSPGHPPVGSRECWDCGQPGHMQGAEVCGGAVLPEPERDWRRIAGSITRAFNKHRLAETQAVNYVTPSLSYIPYPNYSQPQLYAGSSYEGEIDDGRGNGQGLSE